MADHIVDIPADPGPKVQAGPPIPPVVKRALAIVAHAGVACGLGLLVGGLAGSVIGTGVGLIWFWGPPLAIAASEWMGSLGDWDQPRIPPIRRRPHAPPAAQRGHLEYRRACRLAAPAEGVVSCAQDTTAMGAVYGARHQTPHRLSHCLAQSLGPKTEGSGMLSRNRLIRRLRSACSQRRLFTGDRGAIAASLIEIGVAMLAVGILTAGAVTTFTGFIDSASDTTARGRLNDAASTADQVYNWLRPGGARCYDDTDCLAVTDVTATAALQEAAGGQLAFGAWGGGTFPAANTIYVQVDASSYSNDNKSTAASTYATAAASGASQNGIAGDPDDGHWIRLAVRSDSGATFCVMKVAHTDTPAYEGVGYMSVNSADSSATATSAHCGGHEGSTTAANLALITGTSCVYGFDDASTALTPITGHQITNGPATCATARSLGRPGAGTDVS